MKAKTRPQVVQIVLDVLWRLVRSAANRDGLVVPFKTVLMVAGGIASAILGDELAAQEQLRRPVGGVVALRLAQAALREAATMLEERGRQEDARVVRLVLDRVLGLIIAEATR